MTTDNPKRQGTTRRAVLAGAPAVLATVAVSPAFASIPSGADAELIRKVAHWRKCKAAADRHDAEVERLENLAPDHLRDHRYFHTTIIKDGQRHTVTSHELANLYGVSWFDLEDLPPSHPAYKPAQRLATLMRQRRTWATSVGLDVLEAEARVDPLYNAKSDARVFCRSGRILWRLAQAPEGFRAKLAVYQHWADYMGEMYEPALPVLLDECARLIGRV